MPNELSIATTLFLNAKQLLTDNPKMSLTELSMQIMKQCTAAEIKYESLPVHIAFQSHPIELEKIKKEETQVLKELTENSFEWTSP